MARTRTARKSFKMMRVRHGIVRTASGREREMTDREIDAWADEMVTFGERYWSALDALPPDPRGEAYRHGIALVIAEAEDESV
jgi:hypothetical protein